MGNVIVGSCFILFALIAMLWNVAPHDFWKKLRVRVKGSVDEAFQQDATTPEGVKAYYNSVMSKKSEEYQKAYSIHTQLLGKIQSYEVQVAKLQKEKTDLDTKIAVCIDDNNDDGARSHLRQQQRVIEQLGILSDSLEELKKGDELQSEIVSKALTELQDLKAEKEKALLTIEAAENTKMLREIPGLAVSEEDKMLEVVRDGVQRVKEETEGSRIAYESSEFAQQQNLNRELKDAEIERKLQELKAKRN